MDKPLLLLLFNRPKETEILINRLRKIKPEKIYISQDGPRINFLEDQVLCKEVRNVIQKINWKCEIKTRYLKFNLGCRSSVSSAIDWFFNFEDDGIILEDDCIPSKSFFNFCAQMLNKFKNSENIFTISGSNFQKDNFVGEGDYYFSKYAHCWGWATWRRAWKYYDDNMKFWSKLKNSETWTKLHPNKYEKKYWSKIFNLVYSKKIDSWAYVWLASIWYLNGKSIIPNKNLIINIGFNEKATNTVSSSNIDLVNLNFQEMSDILSHPKEVKINTKADNFVFNNHFNGKYNFWPWRFYYILKILVSDPKTFYLKIRKSF